MFDRASVHFHYDNRFPFPEIHHVQGCAQNSMMKVALCFPQASEAIGTTSTYSEFSG